MRILTFDDYAWDDTNSTGNTFSNFFSDWKDCEFFNIFFQDAVPNNQVCKEYLRVSDKMLGKDMVSAKGTWQNDRLYRFVQKANPDIVFAFAVPSFHELFMLRYLRAHTHAKIVLSIVDNVYGPYLSGKKSKRCAEAKRFREIIRMADKLYGASREMCQVYGEEFGVEVSPLYKGCDFTSGIAAKPEDCRLQMSDVPDEGTVSGHAAEPAEGVLPELTVQRLSERPVRIVYAGNLIFGRIGTLAKLARAIEAVNAEKKKFSLEIYSGTAISEGENWLLSVDGVPCYHGRRQYSEIKQILSEADLVLHVESFEPSWTEWVKYSFSTKIIDCLQSGSATLVIGPEGISSVEYPRRIPGTVVIDDILQLEDALESLYDMTHMYPAWAEETKAYAMEHHSIEVLHRRLQKEFAALL